ncbi:peptidyl-prolyl cis-trans isomerase, EpsD family [Duganella sp. CF458]|uniref:EpsD family peptidyl-prolyl cis-trans isomerase n=1 Tax=Duganella sp. CF458 TaxID=1884368 RepID=UPI0008E404CB|nr:EpsD family peptidyl-prolyl cis-trans isomerase [Duganella sp. CF458]SFG51812.1 peptidyl-prolyl cis-trans isomerase, EpsD family [Duganella sp. CF458]
MKHINPNMACAGMLVILVSACSSKVEQKPGQALANVNGEEITVLQLNDELSRSNAPATQQEAARKQALEALIDRQLLIGEAAKEKVDRDPRVVQAIERARSVILAQAYMQKRIGTPAKPSAAEVEAYYSQNPQFFAQRKHFDMREIILPTREVNDELKAVMDKTRSLDEVAAWLDQHKVKYQKAQLSRSGSELPPELSAKLLALAKGQLFIVREGERSMLVTIADIRSSPVELDAARPQIEQYLVAKKGKESAEEEVKRLRASAKIAYINQPSPVADAGAPATALERGVAGLK